MTDRDELNELAKLVVSYSSHSSERNECAKRVGELKRSLTWLVGDGDDDQTSLESDRYVVQHVRRTAKVVDQKLLTPAEHEKYEKASLVTSLHVTSLAGDDTEGPEVADSDAGADAEDDAQPELMDGEDRPTIEDLDDLAQEYVRESERRRGLDKTCRHERDALMAMFEKHDTTSFVVEGKFRVEKMDKAVKRVSVKDLPSAVKARCTVVQVRNILNVVDKKQIAALKKRKR